MGDTCGAMPVWVSRRACGRMRRKSASELRCFVLRPARVAAICCEICCEVGICSSAELGVGQLDPDGTQHSKAWRSGRICSRRTPPGSPGDRTSGVRGVSRRRCGARGRVRSRFPRRPRDAGGLRAVRRDPPSWNDRTGQSPQSEAASQGDDLGDVCHPPCTEQRCRPCAPRGSHRARSWMGTRPVTAERHGSCTYGKAIVRSCRVSAVGTRAALVTLERTLRR
jgi:hypothetical protein